MIKKVGGGGFQLFSKKNPGRALGPVRGSDGEVAAKDEARVNYFANLNDKGAKGKNSGQKKRGLPPGLAAYQQTRRMGGQTGKAKKK